MDKFLGALKFLWLRNEQALEHIGDVSNIEFVVKVSSSFSESRGDGSMQAERSLDNVVD